MIHTGYPINRFHKIDYRNYSNLTPIQGEKFSLEVAKNETISANSEIENIITQLENGNKDSINELEKLGLNYSCTEYQNGYKIKFEHDGNKYTVAYNGKENNVQNYTESKEVEAYDLVSNIQEAVPELPDNITPPVPPSTADYLKEVTYADGMKETLVDEEAYNQALQDYQTEKTEYDAKIKEQNIKTAQKQKQDAANEMQEEWDVFNEQINALREELDTNGTNSKMMNTIMHEFSAEYAELIQRKMEQKLKSIDLLVKNVNSTIPDPPSKSSYETDEEYTEALNVYTYQKFLYEKQQNELELKAQLSERRIKKIDEKLEEIRKLLFGKNVT